MNKELIREAMLALELGRSAQSTHQYLDHLLDARRDASEPVDHDLLSQRVESAEVAEGFEEPMHAHQRATERIRSIDFGPRDTVGPGAVVCMNDKWLVVAEATSTFSVDGTTYIGISTASPIYPAIEGHRRGDVVHFAGREFKITAVE